MTTPNLTRRLVVDRKLINADFVGYKLSPFPADALARAPLPDGGLDVDKLTHSSRLGFRDLQARVRFSHLAKGVETDASTGAAFYINREYMVVKVTFNKNTKETRFYPVAQLIQPLGNIPNYADPDPTVPIDPQFPSVIAISAEQLVAANGMGDIEIVDITVGNVTASARYEGQGSEGVSPVPCVLLAAKLVGDRVTMVVYSRTESKQTKFNIAFMEMNPKTGELKTLHMQQGLEVPVYCAITSDGYGCILGSESDYETVKRECADVEMMSEEDRMVIDKEVDLVVTQKKPLYQWTQTSTDITVQFVLHAGTPKSAVSCNFTNQHLSLMIRDQDVEVSYPFKKLWSTVKADECTWTLERDTGLLSLYLTKHDENTRWPQLFDIDDGVLETLDAHQMSEIAERLEKFTATADNNNNTPFTQAVKHPVATDADDDIDQNGQPVRFTVYDRAGHVTEVIHSGGQEWVSNAFGSDKLPTVCVKSDVDGVVFAFEETNGVFEPKHVATFDAFAFVKASKRDSRFIAHDPNHQFVTIVESNRNAYIYYRHGDQRATEKQTLVDVTLGHDVDILGVQQVLDRVLLILTQSEIVAVML